MLELAVREACLSLGFRRALLSTVDDDRIAIAQVYSVESPDDALRLHEQLVRIPMALSALPAETRALATGEAVRTGRGAPGLPSQLAAVAGRGPYVVAPVVAAGTLVRWLLHADHGPRAEAVPEADRALLWGFAEGLGCALESRGLLDRRRAERSRIVDLILAAERAVSGLEPDLAPLRCGPDAVAVAARDVLTGREVEVLELMAMGATNRVIAEQLVISQSTVKSHAKSILRKLGAHTRAEAVSRYLNAA